MTDISDLLDATPDAEAVDEYWRRICREMVAATAASEYERGLREGYLLATADLKRAQHQAVNDLDAYLSRWHVCCRPCRLAGHQEGCPYCHVRTRLTFGEATPGEPSGPQLAAVAAASWEPLGFGPGPGWVHLGGRYVHWHHPCTAACDYPPGWYTAADAIAIIEALPGDYAKVLDELRTQAAAASGKAAA